MNGIAVVNKQEFSIYWHGKKVTVPANENGQAIEITEYILAVFPYIKNSKKYYLVEFPQITIKMLGEELIIK